MAYNEPKFRRQDTCYRILGETHGLPDDDYPHVHGTKAEARRELVQLKLKHPDRSFEIFKGRQ